MKRILLLFMLVCTYACAGADPDVRYVSVPLAEIHKHASPATELVTQAPMWAPVLVRAQRGPWCEVYVADQYRTEKGYPGWILTGQLQKVKKPTTWCMVVTPKVDLREQPDAKSKRVCSVFLGTKLEGTTSDLHGSSQWVGVGLPGRPQRAWAPRTSLVDTQDIQRPSEGLPIVETAVLLKGTPYLWGGMSCQGIDCSGLTYMSYRLHGYSIPRDADQQFGFGTSIEASKLQAGDLIFFGKDSEHITHVGMFIGEGRFIHASSSLGGVTVTRFDDPGYLTDFQGARRILK